MNELEDGTTGGSKSHFLPAAGDLHAAAVKIVVTPRRSTCFWGFFQSTVKNKAAQGELRKGGGRD